MAPPSGLPERTCLIRTLATLASALRRWGTDLDVVFARAGLVVDQIDDYELRIPISQYRRVWEEALRETGDEAIGLHVLEAFDMQDVLSNLLYIATSAATGQEAFDRVSPFIRLAHEAIEIDLMVEGDRTICKAGFRDWEDDRTLNEYFLGLVVKLAPAVVGKSAPFTVWFRHPAPAYADEYEQILGRPVRFDAPFNAVVGSVADLDQPLPNADALLCSMLERQASDTLERMPRVLDFAETVRHQIEASLPAGEISADAIARSLGLSDRTLRRRLKDCGVTYQMLLDAVRCERARQALSQPGVSIGEVAYSLGFSDASAFHKAFRRWTGKAPGEVVERA